MEEKRKQIRNLMKNIKGKEKNMPACQRWMNQRQIQGKMWQMWLVILAKMIPLKAVPFLALETFLCREFSNRMLVWVPS